MSDPVDLTLGPLDTVLDPPHAVAAERLKTAIEAPAESRRDAVSDVVRAFPDWSEAWAALGGLARDDIEAYACYRVGYHRGLDALRRAGWRGSGYVRWSHESNRGFLRCLDGLRAMAAAIGEPEEEQRCDLFLHQLDPTWPPEGLGGVVGRHRAVTARSRRGAWVAWMSVPGLGLTLAACGNSFSGTTLAQQVTNWATSSSPTLSASVAAIQGDIRRIDAGPSDPPKPSPADCDLLVTDALNANDNLPTPDQTLTDLLSKAYTDAGDAGYDCISGSNSEQLRRSATERAATRRDLIKALARFDAVTSP